MEARRIIGFRFVHLIPDFCVDFHFKSSGFNMRSSMQSQDRLMSNPDLAYWMMFEKPAIEDGVEYDDDVKEKMWMKYMVGYLL